MKEAYSYVVVVEVGSRGYIVEIEKTHEEAESKALGYMAAPHNRTMQEVKQFERNLNAIRTYTIQGHLSEITNSCWSKTLGIISVNVVRIIDSKASLFQFIKERENCIRLITLEDFLLRVDRITSNFPEFVFHAN